MDTQEYLQSLVDAARAAQKEFEKMSQEQVDAILEQDPEDRTGIGIRNVNDRLRIYFGAPYGLNITSELDVGTCVEIRMPKVREGEYEAK